MKKYAKVIVRSNTIHTDNLFTYEIPEFLSNELNVGHRVLVPFGRGNKPTEDFVFEIINNLDENIKTKDIVDILDKDPIFRLEDLELVKWMKNRYLCTYIDCINLIYPKGYKLNNYKMASLGEEFSNLSIEEFYNKLETLNETQKKIIEDIYSHKNKLKIDKLKKIPNINNILYKITI